MKTVDDTSHCLRGSVLAVHTPCFDVSNETNEPKGVCSRKNYLKTCQDATTPCLSSQALSVLVIQTSCVFLKLLQQVQHILDPVNQIFVSDA